MLHFPDRNTKRHLFSHSRKKQVLLNFDCSFYHFHICLVLDKQSSTEIIMANAWTFSYSIYWCCVDVFPARCILFKPLHVILNVMTNFKQKIWKQSTAFYDHMTMLKHQLVFGWERNSLFTLTTFEILKQFCCIQIVRVGTIFIII